MVAAGQCGADGCGDLVPITLDLHVAKAQDTVAECAQHSIPSTILLEAWPGRVELCPVHLNDESDPEKEVDPTDSGDVHLLSKSDPSEDQVVFHH